MFGATLSYLSKKRSLDLISNPDMTVHTPFPSVSCDYVNILLNYGKRHNFNLEMTIRHHMQNLLSEGILDIIAVDEALK